jgi:hypothetical protein
MADELFTAAVDGTDRILALIRELGDVRATQAVYLAADMTAQAVVREAKSRVRRATGETARGIEIQPLTGAKTRGGSLAGVAVVQLSRTDVTGRRAQRRARMVPRYLERGTRYLAAQPYFDASARLEEQNHVRRVEASLRDAIRIFEGI